MARLYTHGSSLKLVRHASGLLIAGHDCWVCSDCAAVSTQAYDASEFEALVAKYEKLNWRIIRWVQTGSAAAENCTHRSVQAAASAQL
jgi:transketolase C-terminal domain/subunit